MRKRTMTEPALCRTCKHSGVSGKIEDYRPFCVHFRAYTYDAIGRCWAESRKRKDGWPFAPVACGGSGVKP